MTDHCPNRAATENTRHQRRSSARYKAPAAPQLLPSPAWVPHVYRCRMHPCTCTDAARVPRPMPPCPNSMMCLDACGVRSDA
eukprot:scaffold54025_cov62-Phaeocystis_antarctica.AAC.3